MTPRRTDDRLQVYARAQEVENLKEVAQIGHTFTKSLRW